MNKSESKNIAAYFGLSVMTLITGLSFIFVKIGLRYTDPYSLLAHRFTIAFLGIIALKLAGLIKIQEIKPRDRIAILGIALFYPILFFGFQVLGLQYSTASEGGIILAFLPVFMLIAGWLFLKERTTVWQKLGVGLSVLGLIFIFWHKNETQSQSIRGIILLLLSVISMIGYFVIGKRIMQRYNSLALTAIMITIGFIAFNIISVGKHITEGNIDQFFKPFLNLPFTWSVIYLGVLSSVISSYLSNYALINIPTSTISIFSNLNPIIAIIGGVLFLGERLLWYDITGAVAVMFGVVLVLAFKPDNR
ncbi:MAG: DMT family transporter [Bacteroidales bacterium]|jgi:drug/metabolite transporter (DMT)-like permease|nr:DMT family transporter [Bacteroidales bacterium]